MIEELPLNKPNPKHNNFKVPPRLNSEGYNKVNGLDPEKQRNIPTNLLEKKEEEKRNELNINAPSFTPKSQNITKFQNAYVFETKRLKETERPKSKFGKIRTNIIFS